MQQRVEHFPDQLQEAIAISQAAEVHLPNSHTISRVVLGGLGGSAFGGEIIRNYGLQKLRKPFDIQRGYEVPTYVDDETLYILSSYSGNTEETLAQAKEAYQRNAQVVAITSGGELARWAQAHGLPHILVPGGFPPRSACGYSIVQQLRILHTAGILPDYAADLNEALAAIRAFGPADHTRARELAQACVNRWVVLYSSNINDAVAIRFRQQINENAKQLCSHHVVPEMNHNELVGWVYPQTVLQNTTVLYLRSHHEHPRTAYRFDLNRTVIEEAGGQILEVWASARIGLLAELLYQLHLADWVSLYLAEANNVDPLPVQVIDRLKSSLAQK
jgi:glucose/mannose-6-phosphate isomerase